MKSRRTLYILWLIIVMYSAVMVLISINRHYTFRTNAFDMGIFMQSLWSTVHGDFMYNTVEWFVFCAPSHFRIHLSPILIVLAPLYGLLPHAETLLVTQTVVIALSAYPLYLLAEKILGESKIALALVVMYLGNSLVQGINSYDFHAVPFAMLFIFMATLMLERGKYGLAILSALGVLSVREDAGIALIALGLFYLLRNRKVSSISTYVSIIRALKLRTLNNLERTSLVFITMGALWILLGWVVVDSSHLASFYGNSLRGCNISMKAVYFLVVNITLGMLTFLRPKYFLLLTALPWAEILLSCEKNLYRIGFQYPYMILPLSMISIIYTLKELQNNQKMEVKKIFSIGVSLGILFSILTTPILPLNNDIKAELLVPPNYYQPITSHDKLLLNITKILEGTNFSILTQNDIFPHLANRINTYVIWTSYCSNTLPETDAILFDNTLPYSMYNFQVYEYLVNYTKVYDHDGIRIWIRSDALHTPEAKKLVRKLEGVK